MQLSALYSSLTEVEADWLIVGIWENEELSPVLVELDGRAGGILARLKDHGDITGKPKEMTSILDVPALRVTRILAVGLGPRAKADFASLVKAAATVGKMLSTKSYGRIALAVPAEVPGLDPEAVARALGVGFM